MDTQILIGLLLTITPIFELRGGIPVVVEYCLRHSVPIWPYFILIIILNTILILFIFFFLDTLHETFMRIKPYRLFVGYFLKKIQIKAHKIEKDMEELGYIALMVFVAIPLPGTGAWTGTLIAWTLGLNRLKSFIAIATGVLIAGLLVLLLSLGVFSGFY